MVATDLTPADHLNLQHVSGFLGIDNVQTTYCFFVVGHTLICVVFWPLATSWQGFSPSGGSTQRTGGENAAMGAVYLAGMTQILRYEVQ